MNVDLLVGVVVKLCRDLPCRYWVTNAEWIHQHQAQIGISESARVFHETRKRRCLQNDTLNCRSHRFPISMRRRSVSHQDGGETSRFERGHVYRTAAHIQQERRWRHSTCQLGWNKGTTALCFRFLHGILRTCMSNCEQACIDDGSHSTAQHSTAQRITRGTRRFSAAAVGARWSVRWWRRSY